MRDLEASRCTWIDKLSVLLRCLCKVLIDLKDVERIRNRYIISQFISPFISISFAYYVRVFVIIFVKNIMRKTQIKYPLSHARTYTHAYTRTHTYTRAHTHTHRPSSGIKSTQLYKKIKTISSCKTITILQLLTHIKGHEGYWSSHRCLGSNRSHGTQYVCTSWTRTRMLRFNRNVYGIKR